jgi:hypothetical protein
MADVASCLAENGIELRRRSLGSHKTLCPRCSHKRKPEHRRDPCLSVTIKGSDCVWKCWNCGWAGGLKSGVVGSSNRVGQKPRHQQTDLGGFRRRLRYAGLGRAWAG